MPAPPTAIYSEAALAAAHTAFAALLDAGAVAGLVRVRSAADALLAQLSLMKPCGTVDPNTGQLTIAAADPSTPADATGSAAYVELCDSTGEVHLTLPAQAGGAVVAGKAVLSTLAIVAGVPIGVVTLTAG